MFLKKPRVKEDARLGLRGLVLSKSGREGGAVSLERKLVLSKSGREGGAVSIERKLVSNREDRREGMVGKFCAICRIFKIVST